MSFQSVTPITATNTLKIGTENVSTLIDNKQDKLKDNSIDITTGDLTCQNIYSTLNRGNNISGTTIKAGEALIVNNQDFITLIGSKQNLITKNDNFIIDSMYVTPLGTKTLVNPAQTGELRASILTVEDNTLGVINVGDSISSITSDLNDKQTTLDKDSDIIVDTITCGNITANLGATIRATTLIATDNLYYGPIQNLGSVEGKIGELETNIGLNTITSATDISCNNITCNDLTSNTSNCSSVFNMADMLKTDSIVPETLQFDTIVIRRPTGHSVLSQNYVISLRELHVWVNDQNILVRNGPFNNTTTFAYFTLWNGNRGINNGHHRTFVAGDVFNNEVEAVLGAQSIEETIDPSIALIIKSVPLTSVNNVQSVVLYNMNDRTFGKRIIGLSIEFYNSTLDPGFTKVVAKTDVIFKKSKVYRFDFPSISTYGLGFTSDESISQITTNALQYAPVIYDTYNTTEIISNVDISGEMTATDVNINGILKKPNQIYFSASKTSSQRFGSVGYLIYDQADLNIGGCYSSFNGVFMPTVAGVYFINFGFFTYLNEAFMVDLWKNDGEIVNRSRRIGTGVSSYTKFELTSIVYLNVGDYLRCRVGSGNIYLESLKQTCFYGYLLG